MSSPADEAHKPEISVAIPFYNPGAFFLPALRSIFAQSFADWELLLIDDGSTDGSLQMASQIRDPRVKVVSDGTNRGLNARLNQGVLLARGEFYFRMDADDIMHPERLRRQLEVLRASSPDVVVGSACYSIDRDSAVVGWRKSKTRQHTGFAARHSFDHPTVAAHTAWFRKNPYTEDPIYQRAEDAELWCRTTAHSEFKWIPEPLLFYREQGVFSLRNYLRGQRALLELVRRLESNPLLRLWLSTKERAKMGIAWALDAARCRDLLVRRRFRRLPAAERAAAQQVVLQVLQTSIPGL